MNRYKGSECHSYIHSFRGGAGEGWNGGWDAIFGFDIFKREIANSFVAKVASKLPECCQELYWNTSSDKSSVFNKLSADGLQSYWKRVVLPGTWMTVYTRGTFLRRSTSSFPSLFLWIQYLPGSPIIYVTTTA